MSKRSRASRRQRRQEERADTREQTARRPTLPRGGRRVLGWAVGIAVVAAIGFLVIGGIGGRTTDVDSGVQALAEQLSGGAVRAIPGTAHTVYHSEQPLPTVSEPRSDGLPTLVWFSGTWCPYCEQMEPYAFETAAEFSDRMIFVEKSLDHDRDAAGRYGVRGSPTFVLIEADGGELARFVGYRSEADFREAIGRLLDAVGA